MDGKKDHIGGKVMGGKLTPKNFNSIHAFEM